MANIIRSVPWWVWPLLSLVVAVINLIRYRADLSKEIRFWKKDQLSGLLCQPNPFVFRRLQLFSQKTPAKSLVKPQTDRNQTKSITSTWHFSSTQPAILKTVKEKWSRTPGPFSL
jgi:hypothetical protein